MNDGKKVKNNRNQHQQKSMSHRMPQEYQVTGEDVLMQKYAEDLLLIPMEMAFSASQHGLYNFSDDIMLLQT